jgi:hypothetical protein
MECHSQNWEKDIAGLQIFFCPEELRTSRKQTKSRRKWKRNIWYSNLIRKTTQLMIWFLNLLYGICLFIDRTNLLALEDPLLLFFSFPDCWDWTTLQHAARRGIPKNNTQAPRSVMSYNFRILRTKMANQVDSFRMNGASSKWPFLRIIMQPIYLGD